MPFSAVLVPHGTPKARLFGAPCTSLSIVASVFSHHLRPSLAPEVKPASLYLESLLFSDNGGFPNASGSLSLPLGS